MTAQQHNNIINEAGRFYDTDSFPIMLDNRASKCLTNVLADFIDTPKPTNVWIKGISGTRVPATYIGTVKCGLLKMMMVDVMILSYLVHISHQKFPVAFYHYNTGLKQQMTIAQEHEGHTQLLTMIVSSCTGTRGGSRRQYCMNHLQMWLLCNQPQVLSIFTIIVLKSPMMNHSAATCHR
jgi:hypothetical protein